MRRVYVAGKYDDGNVVSVLANMRAGIRACYDLLQHGYAPFCPWLDFQFGLIGQLDKRQYQAASMAWVGVCDALVLLPGWERSGGAERERIHAHDMGVPVYLGLEGFYRANRDDACPQDCPDSPRKKSSEKARRGLTPMLRCARKRKRNERG